MKSSKVLEMLEQNRIEELKAALQDEIFADSLKSKPNAKKRYMAMKKYLTFTDSAREILHKPCPVEFQDGKYNAFCNSYSLVLTTEACGELALCEEPDRYPKVVNLIKFDGGEGTIDFARVLAEAKSKGYKLKKSEIMSNDYLMHYDGAYFRIALIDITYSVIDDGEKTTVYHVNGARSPLTIKNNIGIGVIMPVFIGEEPDEHVVVIEAN